MRVSWAERHGGAEVLTHLGDWSEFRDAEGTPTTQCALVRAIPRHGYAVTVTLGETYFRE